jgi:formate hydrogenlyase subunit 4
MSGEAIAAHVAAMLAVPPVLIGIINRTRAFWAGRRGPPVLQTFFDLWRLLRKAPVYSAVSTELFRAGPLVMLASVAVSGLMVPLFKRAPPISFSYDFVVFAYLWGFGRMLLVLSALDTGSAFEGMGASREITWGAMLEPTLFLATGTLAVCAGHTSLMSLLQFGHASPMLWVVRISCAACLLIVLQVEASRVPVDDPATHLELTMIHEVMVLDHSGPELAALQLASGLKLLICAAMIGWLLNPIGLSASPVVVGLTQLGFIGAVAVAVACVESLTARLKLSVVPRYFVLSAALALFALLLSVWEMKAVG